MSSENKRSGYERKGFGPRIVVIGGGTGLSVLLRGLKKVSTNISAIVTVADDGGGSGMIRDELGMLPPGDVRNCIMALADQEETMDKLFQYRFSEGRLKGQNFGNLMIAALTDIVGDFELAVEKIHDILRIKGHVIPVTSENVKLCARLENCTIVKGESKIPEIVKTQNSPIKDVFLEPSDVNALPRAIDAIKSADLIVLGPGSLYSSIIPNLLVGGIKDAIRDARGMKVLICNVMTQAGETDDYSVAMYAEAIEKYLGKNIMEYILVNNHVCTLDELKPYLSQGTRQMCATGEDRKKLSEMGLTVIENNMIQAGDGYIRHDADRISNILMTLFHQA